jgi:hypothetical protein
MNPPPNPASPKGFVVLLRLDTPVLQGGAADPFGPKRSLDGLYVVRPPALRGLLHTFARALFAPLLANEDGLLLRAERLLLGAQGGMKDPSSRQEFGSTFRVTVSTSSQGKTQDFDIRPGANKGRSPGYSLAHPEIAVTVEPRSWACASDPDLPGMLWTVLWCGFSLGSVGLRSRRGYGSLTITAVRPEPRWNASAEPADSLPVFPNLPRPEELEQALRDGFRKAQARARAWLAKRLGRENLPEEPSLGDQFFQVARAHQIRVGARCFSDSSGVQGWWLAMKTLMDACSSTMAANRAGYRDNLGASWPRFASPLWVRFYRVRKEEAEAWVPVCTLGARRLYRSPGDAISAAILDHLDGHTHGPASSLPSSRPSTGPLVRKKPKGFRRRRW